MSVTKTIKASGGDYTTLAAWEDGMDGNLTGAGYSEAQCFSIDDVAAVNIAGWTTTAADYIWIHTDSTARHAGVWNGDKYNLVISNAKALWAEEDFIRLDGLQISVPATDGNYEHPLTISSQVSGAVVYVSNCIIIGSSNGTYYQSGINSSDADTTLYSWNNIIYGVGSVNNAYSAALSIQAAGTAYIYSTVGIGGYRGLQSYGTTVAKNCYFGGAGLEDYVMSGGSLAKTNCASEDLSADDTGGNETQTNCITGVAIDTDTFVNVTATTEDFHLAADGNSPLEDAGVNTSGDAAPLNFTTDIDGETITTWAIGADFRYVAPPSGYINEICLIFES